MTSWSLFLHLWDGDHNRPYLWPVGASKDMMGIKPVRRRLQ